MHGKTSWFHAPYKRCVNIPTAITHSKEQVPSDFREVVAIIDVSSSMGSKRFDYVLSELDEIRKHYPITIALWDVKLTYVEDYDKFRKSWPNVNLPLGFGTDLGAALKWLKNGGRGERDLAIIFTDGYDRFDYEPVPFQYITVILGSDGPAPKNGTVVRIPTLIIEASGHSSKKEQEAHTKDNLTFAIGALWSRDYIAQEEVKKYTEQLRTATDDEAIELAKKLRSPVATNLVNAERRFREISRNIAKSDIVVGPAPEDVAKLREYNVFYEQTQQLYDLLESIINRKPFQIGNHA